MARVHDIPERKLPIKVITLYNEYMPTNLNFGKRIKCPVCTVKRAYNTYTGKRGAQSA